MTRIALVIVPYELGRHRCGVGCGPEHLVSYGAERALSSSNAIVRSSIIALDELFNATGSGEADAAFELIRAVAAEVHSAREAGEFPVVLSGSCFTAVGTVAGLNEPSPGVVWFDAHSDFSEPATSTSGYFDSMGLSVLTGSAWQAMLGTVPNARPVPETSIVLAGARAFDTSEALRLQNSQVLNLTIAELQSPDRLVDSIEKISPAISGLYVHIDLDVIDKAVAPVNVFSEPDGLDGSQLDRLLDALMKNFSVRAVTLSCYDPAYDSECRVPPIVSRLLQTIAKNL